MEGTHVEETRDQENSESVADSYNGITKVKFSGQTGSRIDPVLAAKLATISQEKYDKFSAEIVQRNIPFDIDIDSIVDKPWARNIASSLDDYFNFGFNEHTWKAYAARQVSLHVYRMETGESALEKNDEEDVQAD